MPLILTGTSSSTTLDSSAGLTFSDSSNQSAAASPFGLKNRIINGDMVIDQRNAGASVTPSGGSYTLDRWNGQTSQSSKFTVQRNAGSITPPAGFTNYLGCTSSSAYSVTATDYFNITQHIEGFNVADLGWGTANARTITISFWVRSSLTGTFGGALNNSGASRSYPFTYTISAANTWEQKTVTIAGDTSGTWLTDNGIGITVAFGLGAGSTRSGTAGAWASSWFQSATGAVSVVGTNGATFYITGVQLERNTTATPFEWIPYGTELALCQRYYITVGGDTLTQTLTMMQAFSTTGFNGGTVPFPVKMRTTPTFSYSALSDFYVQSSAGGAIVPTTITQSANEASTMCGAIKGNVSSGLTAGNASSFLASSINARLNFSAEL